jgi:MoxR-like ATPase
MENGMADSDSLPPGTDPGREDLERLAELRRAHAAIRAELAKVIVGQDQVIRQLLVAMFSQGHCLLEGVPGLAKTLMISTLARCLQLTFSRIQFTPDLMPSDITGTEVIQEDKATGLRQFKFLTGPVFAHMILADEINRTPPKTQAALLEAMQERQVTIGGQRHRLPAPFFVLATQNPIEQEGTYPLPEAQQDRFMFKVFVKYPNYDEEYAIVQTTTATFDPQVKAVLSADEIVPLQQIVRRLPVAPHVIHYALRLARATRVGDGGCPPFISEWVRWGAGPRAAQYLVLGAKAVAALEGRFFATTDDVRAIAHPVLRHRIITNFNAESEGITTDRVIDRLLEAIPDEGPAAGVAPSLAKALTP